jgi:hypothetical protein
LAGIKQIVAIAHACQSIEKFSKTAAACNSLPYYGCAKQKYTRHKRPLSCNVLCFRRFIKPMFPVNNITTCKLQAPTLWPKRSLVTITKFLAVLPLSISNLVVRETTCHAISAYLANLKHGVPEGGN